MRIRRAKSFSRTFPILGAALLSFIASPTCPGQERLSPGDRFPEIALPSIEFGEAQSIVDFRGQKLMLHLFASW